MRLTKKSDNLYYTNAKFSSGSVFLDNNGSYTNACVNKLGQLEDIEDADDLKLLVLQPLPKLLDLQLLPKLFL